MKILLTNDDGIKAPGILSLINNLKDEHELYVIAPENQMSGASHSATYFAKELIAKKYDFAGVKMAYSINGTPVDCVYCALKLLIKDKIDLVISGINQGYNLAADILYSGTVGAAREAIFLGTPAMAISLGSYDKQEFDVASKIAKSLINEYMNDPNRFKYLLNINVPLLEEEKIKGIKLVGLEPHWEYNDSFDIKSVGDDLHLKTISTADHKLERGAINGDGSACYNGYVSLTPLSLKMDDEDLIKEVSKTLLKNM